MVRPDLLGTGGLSPASDCCGVAGTISGTRSSPSEQGASWGLPWGITFSSEA